MDQRSAIDPTRMSLGDHANIWCEPRFDRLECLNARFRNHAYAPHSHETYAIGVITGGVELYRYRGCAHHAPAGSVVMLNPDEFHDGRPADGGYSYRMFYPSPRLFVQELSEALGRPVAEPCFGESMVADPALAAALCELHAGLERPERNHLSADAGVLACLTALVRRHGAPGIDLPPAGREPAAVRRAREYLDAHLAENVALEDLAQATGLSRFHLLRIFRAAVGASPHVYLLDRRVHRAKRLLAGEDSLADVAAACGFFDQAHFSKVFKSRTGVPPGQYRRGSNRVQDRAV